MGPQSARLADLAIRIGNPTLAARIRDAQKFFCSPEDITAALKVHKLALERYMHERQGVSTGAKMHQQSPDSPVAPE